MKIAVRILKDSDGYYRAWAPALPGCFAYGPSEEDAQRKLEEAIRGYLSSLDTQVPGNLEYNILTA